MNEEIDSSKLGRWLWHLFRLLKVRLMGDEYYIYSRYDDGSIVKVGDIVQIGLNRKGVISEIFIPGSQKAEDNDCPDGGIEIKFDNGEHQVWDAADEDISLISRKVTEPAQRGMGWNSGDSLPNSKK